MSPSRGIPTSRAYWELKAEQMLNRVFSGETPIEVEIVEPPAPTGPAADPNPARNPAPAPAPRQRSAHALAELLQRRPELVPLGIAGAAITTAVATVALAGFWNQQQQALRQERNLVLLERLRAMGPATAPTTAGATGAPASTGDGLPPPPPDEPWMEELAQLPAANAPAADVLKVPFSSAITQQAPAVAASGGANRGAGNGSGEALPQLVGVVQIPGRSGSAIFQIGGTSTNATVGESIGGSGWRLRAASGDSAVIERGGQVRRISISSGF